MVRYHSPGDEPLLMVSLKLVAVLTVSTDELLCTITVS